MDKTIVYICETNIPKALKKQRRTNFMFGIFMACVTGILHHLDNEQKRQEKMMAELQQTLEELKGEDIM